MVKTMKPLILFLFTASLTLSAFGQEPDKTRLNVALELMDTQRNWDFVQEEILIRAAHDPTRVTESDKAAFTEDQWFRIFHGSRNIDEYLKLRKISVLADRKRAFAKLSRGAMLQVQTANHAYALVTERLTPEQVRLLIDSLKAFDNLELLRIYDRQSKELFSREQGNRIFNLGPYTKAGTLCLNASPPKKATAFRKRAADCDCRQTGTNWSCDHCDPSNSCTPTQAGCSLMWAYPCDGRCADSEYPVDPPQN